MANSSLDAQIQERIAAFTSELSELIRAAALEAVSEALGTQAAAQNGAARPRKAGVPSPILTNGSRKPGKRIRRTAADLEKLMTEIHAYVKANPGQRLEEMSAGMGLTSHEMKRPIVLLLEKKQLAKKGQRRGTTYTAKGRR